MPGVGRGLISVIVAVVGIMVAIAIPLEIERRKAPELTIERSDDLNDSDSPDPSASSTSDERA
jgi:hypothetical protein